MCLLHSWLSTTMLIKYHRPRTPAAADEQGARSTKPHQPAHTSRGRRHNGSQQRPSSQSTVILVIITCRLCSQGRYSAAELREVQEKEPCGDG